MLYLLMLPWQWHICQLNYQKTEVRVVNLLPFLATKGFREEGK